MGLLSRVIGWALVGWCALSASPAWGQTVSRAPFEVSVHARSTRASARSEQAAWLSLTLPLDAAARPRLARVAVAAEAPATTAPAEPTGAPAAGDTPALSFAQLRALSDFSRRATVVALSVAGAATERRRLDSLSTRARVSAALPELRLRAQRNTDQALRWAPTNDDPYRVTQADGAGTTLEASATFRLDRLLFTSDELSVERLREQAGSERLKLERRVLDAVLGAFRSRELACAQGAEPEARLSHQLLLAQQLTELDVLTAGWCSGQLSTFAQAVWGFPEAVLGACTAPAPSAEPAPTKPVASLAASG